MVLSEQKREDCEDSDFDHFTEKTVRKVYVAVGQYVGLVYRDCFPLFNGLRDAIQAVVWLTDYLMHGSQDER
jgi:hypothetical protein